MRRVCVSARLARRIATALKDHRQNIDREPAIGDAGHGILATKVLASPFTAELIIVDDGSHDGTLDLANSLDDPRVRVLGQPVNQGKGAALRRGFAEAAAPFVLVQDVAGVRPGGLPHPARAAAGRTGRRGVRVALPG
jgi:hypothetical protein